MNQSNNLGVSNLLQQIISPNDVVLDLGSFASGTTRAFLKKGCRCYVEDLPELIDKKKHQHQNLCIKEQLAEHLMILEQDVKVDVILTWDLFHYLELNIISYLFDLLADKIVPSTIIHATRHTNPLIPKSPQRFKLLDDFSFEVAENQFDIGQERIPNQSHATIDLLKRLQYFNLYDTLTHKSQTRKGLVEYVLCHGKNLNKVPEQKKSINRVSNKPKSVIEEKAFSAIGLPNLQKLFSSYQTTKANNIIDCSGPLVSNQTRLYQISQNVFEEDIYSFMAWQQKTAVGSQFAISDQMLRYHSSVKFDLVMLWDLVNFWKPHQTSRLIEKIVQHMQPKGVIHLVLPHSGGVASKPANYRISSDYQIRLNGVLCGETKNKIISTGELVRLLPNFKVAAYYFGTLRNGENYQEYLFEYQGIPH